MRHKTATRALAAAVLVPFLIVTTGCGAIFNGTRQTIQATSAPDAATITTQPLTSEFTTPASLNLERKYNYTLTFEREGYRPATFQIQRHMQGGILALDILFTGLLGVIIDAATGAWYKLSPETAVVSLTRISGDGPETIEVTIVPDGEDSIAITSTETVAVRVEEAQ